MFYQSVLDSLRHNTLSVLNCAQLGLVPISLTSHRSSVQALAALADNKLASGSADTTIRIWNTHSGETLNVLKGHTNCVSALAALPDDKLASGSKDTTIRIWNTLSGKTLKVLKGHTKCVCALAALPDNKLASGSSDMAIGIWDTSPRNLSAFSPIQMLRVLRGHAGPVCTLTVLPNGMLASGSYDQTIRIWNTHSGETLKELKQHADITYTLTSLPDGRLVSGSDCLIHIWDTVSGTILKKLTGRADPVCALIGFERTLASASCEIIHIWDAKKGTLLRELRGHTDSVQVLTILPDGRLVSGSCDRTICIWPLVSQGLFKLLQEALWYNTSLVGLEYKGADLFLSDKQKTWLESVVQHNVAIQLSTHRTASSYIPPNYRPGKASGAASTAAPSTISPCLTNKARADRELALCSTSAITVQARASAPPSHLLDEVDDDALSRVKLAEARTIMAESILRTLEERMRVLEASFEARVASAVAAALLPTSTPLASAPPSHLFDEVGGAASTAAPRSFSAVRAPVEEDPTNKF